MKPVLAALGEKYPDLRVEWLEVYHNTTNQQIFLAASSQYGIGNAGVPLIIIGNHALMGDADIRNHLEENILAERERLAACNGTAARSSQAPPPSCTSGAAPLTLPIVALAAIIDSINPCAFAILIVLLIPLSLAGNRHRILLVGGTYVGAVFLFHLLLGIGLFSAVSLSGFSRIFSVVGAGIAIILGLVTILDVARNRETYLLSVPASKKGLIGRYLEKLSVPAAAILGVLAGLFGFSCTGGIYIGILSLMGRSLTLAAGIPYLVLYNVIFVLPLALVVLLAAYGIAPDTADRWRIGNRRLLRLVIGAAMVAVGLVILSGWMG